MLSLWSRASPARSTCRCRLCIHTAPAPHIVARRSTTAASRRKVTAADIFTACYTTILGTATILDAQRKEVRKQELDGKLEKARAALDNLAVRETANRTPEPGQPPDNEIVIDATTEPRLRTLTLALKPDDEAPHTTGSLLAELKSLCEVTHRPKPAISWSDSLLDWINIEASIVAEENNPDDVLREPNSSEQLTWARDTVLDLVDELLWRSQKKPSRQLEDVPRERTEGEEMILRELQEIRQSPHYPNYESPALDPARTSGTRSLMNEAIRRILYQPTSDVEKVGKICYNLLTSSSLPSIHTYNTLMAGFNRIRRPDLAQAVVDSYIYVTPWPATQQTIACLLCHYRGLKSVKGLRNLVKLMRGVKDTGLKYYVVSRDKVHGEEWLKWIREKCASRTYTFVQRAHRGNDVFKHLITTWLHLGRLGVAAMVFVACLRNGAMVPVQTLQSLLDACIAAVDHATANKIARGIMKWHHNFMEMYGDMLDRYPNFAIRRQLIESLSKLLQLSYLPYDMMDVNSPEHLEMTRLFKSFIDRAMTQIDIHESAKLCEEVTEALNLGGSLIENVDKLDMAIMKLANAQRHEQRRQDHFAGFDAVARVFMAERWVRKIEARTRDIVLSAKAMILKFKTGWDVEVKALPQRSTTFQQRRQHGLLSALESIQLNAEEMTQEDVKRQLLEKLPDARLANLFRRFGDWENLTIRALVTFYEPVSSKSAHQKDDFHRYSKSTRQVAQRLDDATDISRALLFTHLGGDRQRKVRYYYPVWCEMPLEKLVEYHTRYIDFRFRGYGESRYREQQALEYENSPDQLGFPEQSEQLQLSPRQGDTFASPGDIMSINPQPTMGPEMGAMVATT
ncbi:hypothetical protein F4778DRAFT_746328 [Xylariomycetidae sp. FL2044]|nr:hypothetical protein F4778DRAFT_746328 [Xylariomycetidae sp. FL2044]